MAHGALNWTKRVSMIAAMALAANVAVADTTIRMWTFLDPAGQTGREKVLKKLIDGFEAANRGVTIAVEPQVFFDDLSNATQDAFVNGTDPMEALKEAEAAYNKRRR